MKGFNNDTITVSGEYNFAEYNLILPGSYKFWVTGYNNEVGWDSVGSEIDIHIKKPWFWSDLAVLFYIIFLTGLIIFYNRFRLKNLRSEKGILENESIEKSLHLLIVEDNADLRSFLRKSLSGEYSIYEADDAISGINIAFERIPDLIITDLIMPDMDGIELCKKLKNDERTSHIPIIVLTARTTLDDKVEGLLSE